MKKHWFLLVGAVVVLTFASCQTTDDGMMGDDMKSEESMDDSMDGSMDDSMDESMDDSMDDESM